MAEVIYAVEGATDEPIAEALIRMVGHTPRKGPPPKGKTALDRGLARWNRSSNRQPMLVLRDWDRDDGNCAPELLARLMPDGLRTATLAVRIPVRSIESWLLADIQGFSKYFRVDERLLPSDPDELENPKSVLIRVCAKAPAQIRNAMQPRQGSGRAVGPEYTALVTEFGSRHWDGARARENSPSLHRSLCRLEELTARGLW
jgi:hypothetical protein